MELDKKDIISSEKELYEKIWKRKESKVNLKIEKGSRVDIALKLLEKGEKILDIGCGDGILGYYAKTNYKQIHGIDISDIALNIAKQRGVITKKVNTNTETLPFEDNYFDAITCLDVLEHVFDPIQLINEIHRVLKNNGIVIISTPNIRYWHNIFNLLFLGKFPRTSADEEHYDGGHIHYFTFGDIENMLKNKGFKIVQKSGVFRRNNFIEFLSPGIVIKATKLFKTNTFK